MNAAQARERTGKSLSSGGDVFDAAMASVYARIIGAADQGRYEVGHPLHDVQPYPSVELTRAVRLALESAGYVWTHHPEPAGSKDPRERAYDTVSWKTAG